MDPSVPELKFFLMICFGKKEAMVCFLEKWQPIFSQLKINIALSINKTNKSGKDINDDIHRCLLLELELCASTPEERAKERHSHTCLCVCLCVCARESRVRFPQMFPLTFDPAVGWKGGSSPDK